MVGEACMEDHRQWKGWGYGAVAPLNFESAPQDFIIYHRNISCLSISSTWFDYRTREIFEGEKYWRIRGNSPNFYPPNILVVPPKQLAKVSSPLFYHPNVKEMCNILPLQIFPAYGTFLHQCGRIRLTFCYDRHEESNKIYLVEAYNFNGNVCVLLAFLAGFIIQTPQSTI